MKFKLSKFINFHWILGVKFIDGLNRKSDQETNAQLSGTVMEMTNLLDNSNTEEQLEELETNVDQIEPKLNIEQRENDENEGLEKDSTVVELPSELDVHPAAVLTQVQIHYQGSNEMKDNEDVTEVTF